MQSNNLPPKKNILMHFIYSLVLFNNQSKISYLLFSLIVKYNGDFFKYFLSYKWSRLTAVLN